MRLPMPLPMGALAALSALTLAGCVETVPMQPVVPLPAPLPAPEEDTCGRAQAARFVGLDVAVLALLQRSGPTRVIAPDQPVTMDYNPERLNVFTTASGRIDRLTCG